jgi:hypothetical protein
LGFASIVIIPIATILIIVAAVVYFSTLILPMFMLVEFLNPYADKISENTINMFMLVTVECWQRWYEWSIFHIFMQFLLSSVVAISFFIAIMTPFIICYHVTLPGETKLKDE